MINYDFLCPTCGIITLRLSPSGDNLHKQKCPTCKSVSRRQYKLGGITFVGSGFHVNDYKSDYTKTKGT